MNTDASILVYKFRPKRTSFNMYEEYTQLQLTFHEYNLVKNEDLRVMKVKKIMSFSRVS